jgi:hypothetical protein
VLRPLRRDATGRRLDPERHQLLEHAARMGIPMAPGASEDLLVIDGAHAAAAIALILATPMRNGLFRGVEVWSQGRQPPSPSDYTVLESGALSMNVDAPGANPGTRLPQAGGRASRPARSRVSICVGAMTALDDALRASETERTHRLLATGADPNRIEPISGERPLQAAIKNILDPAARYCAVSHLLAYGADPDRCNRDGTGPLYLALMHRDARVLELLLRFGGSPNAESAPGQRSLLWLSVQDYCLDTYGGRLPEVPGDATCSDPDALIEFLDRLAARQRKPRPECLQLLRLYAADGSEWTHGPLIRRESQPALFHGPAS